MIDFSFGSLLNNTSIIIPNPSCFSIRSDSSLCKYYFQQGEKEFDSQKYSLAIDYFSKVIAMNSNYPEVYEYRGYCYSQLKDFNKAINDYNKAINNSSKDALLYIYI